MRSIIYILVSGVLGVTGQLVLKRGLVAIGSQALRPDTLLSFVASLALNPLIVGGLAVYVLGTLFWLVALSRLDLSYAYPFVSLGFVMITLYAHFAMTEPLSTLKMGGIALITVGVFCVAKS